MASTTLFRAISTILCGACASLLWNDLSRAHGFAGKRFFPATLVIEDPFVADELSLPTIAYRKLPGSGDEPATNETDFAVDMSKRVTEKCDIWFGLQFWSSLPVQRSLLEGLAVKPWHNRHQQIPGRAIVALACHAMVGNVFTYTQERLGEHLSSDKAVREDRVRVG